MNQPTDPTRVSPPWLLIVGLLLGAGLLVYMAWDSIGPSFRSGASKHVVELTDANWQKEVLESDIPVFVDFTAKWCGPCKEFAPTVAKLAERYQGKFKVAKFDVGDTSFDKGRKMQELYSFRGIPHIMIFKGGKPVTFQNSRSEAELARVFDRVLAPSN